MEKNKDQELTELRNAFIRAYNSLEFFEGISFEFIGHEGRVLRKVANEVRDQYRDLAEKVRKDLEINEPR